MQTLKNILTPTGRAALIALVVSLIAMARLFGFVLPENTGDTVSKLIDTLGIFVGVALTGSALHKAAPPAAALLLFMSLPMLGGCSSFLHFKDPGAQAVTCGITAALRPEIEAIAASFGFPISVIEALYAEGCTVAAKEGKTQDEAQKYGLAHARAEGAHLKKLGAHFEVSK